jgi:acyl transferase domain-containing protein
MWIGCRVGVSLLSEAVVWPVTGAPRRAGVSSFGISGTNAHVIIEQAPPAAAAVSAPVVTAPATWAPWLVSGRSEAAMRARAGQLVSFLDAAGPVDLASVGHALATRRTAFSHRAIVHGHNQVDLVAGLSAVARGVAAGNAVEGHVGGGGGVVLVFPGQGSQWVGMARELLAGSSVFAAEVAACDAALSRSLEWSVGDVLRGAEGAPELSRVDVVAPALFTVMVSLAGGVAVVRCGCRGGGGAFPGEVAAAYVAGALRSTTPPGCWSRPRRRGSRCRGCWSRSARRSSEVPFFSR